MMIFLFFIYLIGGLYLRGRTGIGNQGQQMLTIIYSTYCFVSMYVLCKCRAYSSTRPGSQYWLRDNKLCFSIRSSDLSMKRFPNIVQGRCELQTMSFKQTDSLQSLQLSSEV